MAGYNGYSMSNNAVAAYESGEKPFSKWTKSDILDEIPTEIREVAKKLTVSEMRSLFLYQTSWHHTSSMYNRTYFYSVNTDITEEQILDIIASRQPKEEKKETAVKAFVRYGEWTGTRKHPKLVEHEDYAVIVGNWAYLPGNEKKRTDGKHFRVLQTFSKAPKGTAQIFKQIEKGAK